MKTLKPWLRAVRDFFIPYLPSGLVRLLIGSYDFAFVGHPLILEDLSRQYPNLKNKNLLKFVSKNLWPVLGSEITGFKNSEGKQIKGIVLFCPMSTRLLVLRRKKAIQRLFKIMVIAKKLGVKIVGLGAYVPIVTNNGKLLAKKSNLNITTGASFSAIIAVTNAIRIARDCHLDFEKTTVGIVGAGGSVGTICARLLMDHFHNFILIDKREQSLDQFLNNKCLKNIRNKTLILSTKIESLAQADLIVVTTNTPGVIVRAEHLSPGAIVIDAAQPRNVSAKIPFLRKDVLVIESGIAEVEGINTNFKFDLQNSNEVYSCLAEVLILIRLNLEGKFVGESELSYIYKLQETANKIGINIPRYRNRTGYLTSGYIKDFITMVEDKKYLNLEESKNVRFVQLPA